MLGQKVKSAFFSVEGPIVFILMLLMWTVWTSSFSWQHEKQETVAE